MTAKHTTLPIVDHPSAPAGDVGTQVAADFDAQRRESFLQAMTRAVEEGGQLTVLSQSGSFLLLLRPIIVEHDCIQCYTQAIDGIAWTTIRFAEMQSFKLS